MDRRDSPAVLPVHRASLPLITEGLSRHCCCRVVVVKLRARREEGRQGCRSPHCGYHPSMSLWPRVTREAEAEAERMEGRCRL
nr:hypothetical protein Itr_chr04CG17750 [Ipomoea trifida]